MQYVVEIQDVENENTVDLAEETETVGVTDEVTDESQEPPVSSLETVHLPNNLKLVTFNLSVSTKNYQHLVELIKEIENLERVIRVNQVTLAAPGEEELLLAEETGYTLATIQLTTFFHNQ